MPVDIEGLPCSAFVLNKIYICVDVCRGPLIEGRVFHKYLDEVNEFRGINELLFLMEGFMDEMRFPAASTDSRFFGKEKNTKDLKGAITVDRDEVVFDLKENGRKATFIVQVQYRQNATWQGSIKWVETDEEKKFRSALELIKIIDSAIGDTNI